MKKDMYLVSKLSAAKYVVAKRDDDNASAAAAAVAAGDDENDGHNDTDNKGGYDTTVECFVLYLTKIH